MTPPRSDQGFVRMPEHEFEAILARAAEAGARRALADVGLKGKEAALDIRDLRSLLDCILFVRRTAVQAAQQKHRRPWSDTVAVPPLSSISADFTTDQLYGM